MAKPSVFIGSSREGLEVARGIQNNLCGDAEVTIWGSSVFGLNRGFLESLVNALERFDFAILVLTPDDLVTSRDIVTQAPRDNVMFELGLFMGRLGRDRVFAVCSDAADMKLPSDLAGVSLANYQSDRSDGDLTQATAPACNQIRGFIRDLGISQQKSVTRLNSATDQVEGISTQVAHLVSLLARSAMLAPHL
jgi:predicted nucleotide-binding protein